MFTNKEKEVAQLEKIIILIATKSNSARKIYQFFLPEDPKNVFFTLAIIVQSIHLILDQFISH